MNDEINCYIEALRQTVTTAGFNYDIWWVYMGADTQLEYTKTMKRYGLFFQTSRDAHLIALLVELYRLYETRDDTINIPSLLKLLKARNTVPSSLLESLDARYAVVKLLWKKVIILRNRLSVIAQKLRQSKRFSKRQT